MSSFQITLTPSRRAAARYVTQVRRALQMAFAQEATASGLTQSDIARNIGVHRSVINREFKGQKDITHGRVGELAWAMGYRPRLVLERIEAAAGTNATEKDPAPPRQAGSTATIYPSTSSPTPTTSAQVNVYEYEAV